MMSSKKFDRLVIAGTVIVTLCVVPFLLRFENTHAGWSEESSDSIAAMSAGDRDDLVANYVRLDGQLSTDQRTAIEQIHETIANDSTMSSRLDTYHDWLRELEIVERDSIRSATTPEKTVAMIQTVMAETEEKYNGFFIDTDDWLIKRKGEEFSRQLQIDLEMDSLRPLWITNREYGSMVDVFVSAFPDEAKAAFETSVSQIDSTLIESEQLRLRGAAMGKAMFDYVRRTQKRSSRTNRSPRVEQAGSVTQISAELADKVLTVLEDSEKREKLKALSQEQKQAIVSAIRMNGLNPFKHMQRYLPSDREAADFFTGQTRELQIKLMSMPTTRRRGESSQRQRLNLMFVEQNEDAPEDIRAFASSILSRLDRPRSSKSGRKGGRSSGRSGGRGDGPPPDRGRHDESNRPKRPGQR